MKKIISKMFWKKKNNTNVEQSTTDPNRAMENNGEIKVVIKTDLGNVRTNNEDAASFFRIADEAIVREKGCLLLVADGMGGHLAGEVASKMAVDVISGEYFKKNGSGGTEKLLGKAFSAANKRIFELASANEQYRGMGTTCTAIAIVGKIIYFAHAGDSRAYLYKDKLITRITEDHTYVQQLVNNGDITPAEADIHPQRNVLTNAMGTKADLRIDTGKCLVPFEQGDRLFLCSDGLYDYLNDSEIAAVLDQGSLLEAADYFISEAKNRGGMDNITVVLAEIENVSKEKKLKSTGEVYLPKLTRDADLPVNINNL
ncbi:MAG: Stp1/IreP family PP2C-type Ser/Thr phosphatase [Ferruginibacter sp.]